MDSGYREPPPWRDEEEGGPEQFAPKGKRQLKVRIQQVQLMFPVDSGAEYRWGYRDGSYSPWKPAPNKDLLRAPPGACAVYWREKGETSGTQMGARRGRKAS